MPLEQTQTLRIVLGFPSRVDVVRVRRLDGVLPRDATCHDADQGGQSDPVHVHGKAIALSNAFLAENDNGRRVWLGSHDIDDVMPVAIENESTRASPKVADMPQHGISAQLVESIFCIDQQGPEPRLLLEPLTF